MAWIWFVGRYGSTRREGNAMGAAVKAATDALSLCGGKLIVFQSGLVSHGVGALKVPENTHNNIRTKSQTPIRDLASV